MKNRLKNINCSTNTVELAFDVDDPSRERNQNVEKDPSDLTKESCWWDK